MKYLFKYTILICVSCFFMGSFSLNAQSGDEQMDKDIKQLIADLHMNDKQMGEFIKVYESYGMLMRKAVEGDRSSLELYMIYKRASNVRDDEMAKILSKSQFKIYYRRQKQIDNKASKRYRNN